MSSKRNQSIAGLLEMFNQLTIKVQLIILLSPIMLVAAYVITIVLFKEYQHLISHLLYFTKVLLLGTGIVTLATPLIIKIALKAGIVDGPGKKDSIKEPVPLLGGVSVFLSFMIVLWLFQPWDPQMRAILLGSGIILLAGTIDDIRPIPSTVRLIAQVIAIAIVLSSGLLISFMPETAAGKFVAYVITVMWIIGITNAMNFIDGADGLAAGVALIAGFFFFLISLHLGQFNVSLICAAISGCCIGFLLHNFRPARIYLGDGGSTFLGFILACVAVYGSWSAKGHIVALGIPLLILGVLIFDMVYITVSRVKNGAVRNLREWLDYTGHDHFHHRLMNLGFKEEHAVIFIYIISFILGISALVLEKSQLAYHVVILTVQAILLFTSITMLMLVGRKGGNTAFWKERREL